MIKERVFTIIFLKSLGALPEYSPAVSGAMEVQGVSFSMRERH